MKATRFLVLHCGTNNIDNDKPTDIAEEILSIANYVHERKPDIVVIIVGLLPRDQFLTSRRQKLNAVNDLLDSFCKKIIKEELYFIKPAFDWTHSNGTLDKSLYYKDFLHLSEKGNEKFVKSIAEVLNKILESKTPSRSSPTQDIPLDSKLPTSVRQATTLPPKTRPKQNGQITSTTFTTTELPQPSSTVTLPPTATLPPALKIPTAPPTTTLPLISTIPPTLPHIRTATLTPKATPTATLPPKTSRTLKATPTTILPPKMIRIKTLPPKVTLTKTLPPTATIPSTTTLTTKLTPTKAIPPQLTPAAPSCNNTTQTDPTYITNQTYRIFTTFSNFISIQEPCF